MARLREAHLMENRLETLPDTIGGLTELRELRLMDNQVRELPDGIGALARLRLLDLRNNRLGRLPDAVAGLRSSPISICATTDCTPCPRPSRTSRWRSWTCAGTASSGSRTGSPTWNDAAASCSADGTCRTVS
ncbi:hypothetical protein ACFQZC_30970 [Streptacidiphilus monticola]